MTVISNFFDDCQLTFQPTTKQWWMQKLWSRDPEFLKTIQKYADEKLTLYNQTAPHTAERCALEMSDGLKLRGVRFLHPGYTSEMIIFGGLRQYCEYFVEQAWMYHQTFTSNVLIFDIRGTHEEHTKEPTEEAIIQDSVELVTKTIEEKKVLPSAITLYGTSLGGAIATIAAGKLADMGIVVPVVNERSFRNLSSVIKSIPVMGNVFANRVAKERWIFDVEEAVKKLKGKFIVVYHPDDYYIHRQASLRQALLENPPNHFEPIIIEMKDDDTICSDFEKELPSIILHYVRGHNRNLNTRELQQIRSSLT
jgi:hypothetical protein